MYFRLRISDADTTALSISPTEKKYVLNIIHHQSNKTSNNYNTATTIFLRETKKDNTFQIPNRFKL